MFRVYFLTHKSMNTCRGTVGSWIYLRVTIIRNEPSPSGTGVRTLIILDTAKMELSIFAISMET